MTDKQKFESILKSQFLKDFELFMHLPFSHPKVVAWALKG